MSRPKLPPGITERPRADGSVAYHINVTVQGVRRTATADTLEEAKQRKDEIKLALMRGEDPDGETRTAMTLGKAADGCFAIHWRGTKSEASYAKLVPLVVQFFGADLPVTSLVARNGDDWVVDHWVFRLQEQGNSGATINRKLTCLSKILRFAETRGALDRVPRMPRQKESAGRMRFFSDAEVEQIVGLLSQWSMPTELSIFLALLDTGMRPSELWNLQTRDVHCDTAQVHIRDGKTSSSVRVVPLTKRALAALRSLIGDKVGAMKVVNHNNAMSRVWWDRVRHAMGMDDDPEFVLYLARHTFGSRLVQRGVELQVVKDLMGHKTIQTTLRYAKLANHNKTAAIAVLE